MKYFILQFAKNTKMNHIKSFDQKRQNNIYSLLSKKKQQYQYG